MSEAFPSQDQLVLLVELGFDEHEANARPGSFSALLNSHLPIQWVALALPASQSYNLLVPLRPLQILLVRRYNSY